MKEISENISSGTLFHFTNSLDNIISIFKSGFRLNYVAEKIPNEKGYYIAQMVCFCDIPLGSVKVHLHRYGDYGIGIRKKYCKDNAINPVFYIYNPDAFDKIFGDSTLNKNPCLPLIKKCIGEDIKLKKFCQFYDEREWRYVHKNKCEVVNISRDDAMKLCIEKNSNISDFLKLPIDKIEYIIIKKPNEIYCLFDFIDSQDHLALKTKKLLYTKIITSKKIKLDF